VISGEKAAMSTISTVALGETDVLRRSGLETVGDVPWGTHFCQFYETANDLIDILVPYFKAGLGDNEFCMWVTSEPLSREEAENAMRKAVPDFAKFLKRGQMEIVSYGEWYLKDGAFDLQRVLDAWIGKLNEALAKGYDGIRVAGNTAWLEKKDWKDFADYEEKVNSVIGKYRMIVVCTYSISKCGAAEVIDVICNHQFALIRREGKWELIESSEIKQTKEALRASEEKYGSVVENTKDAIVITDLKGNVLFGNEATEELTGYTLENGVRMNVRQVTPLKYWPKSLAMLLKAKQGKQIPYFESMIKRKDGTLIQVESGGQAIFKNGKAVGVQIIIRDITQRKEMEEKLKQYSEHLEEMVQKRTEELLESERRYLALVEEASDGVAILQDEKIVFASRRVTEIVGYSQEELIELSIAKLVNEKYPPIATEHYQGTLLQGETLPPISEIELINKTGENVLTEISSRRISHYGRPAVLVILRDVRERKRMEEQHLRLEKLATMGELATMVAHDLRNPLTSIRNACFYIKNTYPARADAECKNSLEMLEIVEKEILTASNIVNDLLDFATRRPLQKKKQNINNLIDDSLKSIHIPENISAERKYAKKAAVAVDEKQLERVFINLTKNAVQAMPNGGTLTIATNETKDHVEIAFTDTGTGIQEENMNKLFSPLFTTKAKGIGVGLAICKKIVEQHGGTIEAQSKAGQGTTFTIKLPKKEEENTQ
jgi:PAS domain S-box-containing protein